MRSDDYGGMVVVVYAIAACLIFSGIAAIFALAFLNAI